MNELVHQIIEETIDAILRISQAHVSVRSFEHSFDFPGSRHSIFSTRVSAATNGGARWNIAQRRRFGSSSTLEDDHKVLPGVSPVPEQSTIAATFHGVHKAGNVKVAAFVLDSVQKYNTRKGQEEFFPLCHSRLSKESGRPRQTVR